MKIAVNLFLTSPKSVTGAFVYIQNILPSLFEIDKNNSYYLIGEPESIGYFKSLYGNLPNIKFYSVSIKRDFFLSPFRATRKLWAKIRRNYSLREGIIKEEVADYLQKNNVSIYFSPAQTIYPQGLENIKFVTTILDLQFEYFPENFLPKYLEKRRSDCLYATKNSSRLIAISNYTKKSLEDKYKISPEKIKVIYFGPQKIDSEPTPFPAPKDFLLYPAALWPHKNHKILIGALGILKNRFPQLCLVFTGMSKGGLFKKDLELIAESENLKDRVLFLGYVRDKDLSSLYKQAKALVFPSNFEGFGLPIIEAFQNGLPVIAANNTSIAEVVGDAGILFETNNAENLAKEIEKVLTDNNLRKNLIQKGYERAKIFSWKKATEETLSVFLSA